MAAIGIPNREPWIVGQRAYRALMDRLSEELENAEDRQLVENARGLGGLDLALLPEGQARRISSSLAQAARGIRLDIERKEGASDWDSSFADLLASLEERLQVSTD